MNSATNNVYVFSGEAVRKAVKALVAIRTHEHFAGYLAVLNAIRSSGSPKISPAEITKFHDRYLRVDGYEDLPFVSPFWSRGKAELHAINKNVAGSYSPRSLREGRPIVKVLKTEGSGNSATYSLVPDHATIASRVLLHGNKVPAVALSAFLFRDYGFALESKEIGRILNVFRDQFGLRAENQNEASAFNILFIDDSQNFSDNDLVTTAQS